MVFKLMIGDLFIFVANFDNLANPNLGKDGSFNIF